MTICLSNAGKRFNRDWIFRHIDYQFDSGQSYAITGANGSGKSTLLQCLSGVMMINEGKIRFEPEIPEEKIYLQVSICAPYLDVVEEMTAREFFAFHQEFKPFLPGLSIEAAVAAVGLEKAIDKQIRYYSSGMKQRIKLGQCIFSQTPVMLLDEPCTNLDQSGIRLYHSLIGQYGAGRLIIVSSNDEAEYSFCQHRLHMHDFK